MPFSIPTLFIANYVRESSHTSLRKASNLSQVWIGQCLGLGLFLYLKSITIPNNYNIYKQNIFLLTEYKTFTDN